jgi:NAD(P)-dependent dehydrogenase (short-subunit alcohol dehydrogenase family)
MEQILEGKTIVVTGAGQGIGLGIAKRAALLGANVVVNDLGSKTDATGVTKYSADLAVEQITQAGGNAIADRTNIAETGAGDQIIETATKAFGGLNGVVNNAGILRDKIFHKMSDADWDAVIAVHLRGYFNVSRAAAGLFKEQGHGAFVHFSSASGLIGSVGQANYAAAKMGIVGLSNSIALDMMRFNVRSNVVAPWAWSDLVATVPIKTEEMAKRMEALRKYSRAEQIAPIVTFLLSDLASNVNGQIFGARGKEVYLFDQPRPNRMMHSGAEEWSEQALSDKMLPMFRDAFSELKHHRDVISWNPTP